MLVQDTPSLTASLQFVMLPQDVLLPASAVLDGSLGHRGWTDMAGCESMLTSVSLGSDTMKGASETEFAEARLVSRKPE